MTKAGDQYVRKAVSFNPANPEQRRLYEWVMKRANGNFSAYIKKTLAAEYQRQTGGNLTNKQRSAADSRANEQADNEKHKVSPPIRTNGINVSIGQSARNYTRE